GHRAGACDRARSHRRSARRDSDLRQRARQGDDIPDPPADRCASGREAQCDDARGAAGMKESRGSVLFLDDDPPILNGLRMRLHRFDGQWEMRFTDCGEDALAELERWEADVVVSDVRMPGMDGVEFLRIVSERWPHTIRIALSGFAGVEQVAKLVPYAHQYLNKPSQSPQ